MPMRPHREITSLLILMIAPQFAGANYVDGLEGALDNGMFFVNSPNGHRLQLE